MQIDEHLWIGASQIVTPIGGPVCGASSLNSLKLFHDATILVRNNKIVAIGNLADVKTNIKSEGQAQSHDARGCVIVPGLVDAHTHPVFAGTREHEYEQRIKGKTYKEISNEGGGIKYSVRATRQASEDTLFRIAQRHANLFLASGTTTIEGKSGYGLSLNDELKLLQVLKRLNYETPLEVVSTFLGAHEIPHEYERNAKNYINFLSEKLLPQVVSNNLAEYCDIFCEPHIFPLDLVRDYLTRAKELGLKLRIHADQLTHSGGTLLAAELKATTADHLEQTDTSDLIALKKAGVFPVLLPGSVFHLGLKQYPPAREMIELGLPIVLATDFNPGSSPSLSLPMAMSLACTQMNLTPAEALTACTLNAAHSLGRGNKIGSLEVGKQADFALFRVSDYRQIPYFFGMNLVDTVVKKGKVVWQASANIKMEEQHDLFSVE